MTCKSGDVVLVKFPFTTLVKSKKRPVLVMKNESEHGDFVCFQITSKSTQNKLCAIEHIDIENGNLKLQSYVNYDKCFTLNVDLVEKKLVSVNLAFMKKIKNYSVMKFKF